MHRGLHPIHYSSCCCQHLCKTDWICDDVYQTEALRRTCTPLLDTASLIQWSLRYLSMTAESPEQRWSLDATKRPVNKKLPMMIACYNNCSPVRYGVLTINFLSNIFSYPPFHKLQTHPKSHTLLNQPLSSLTLSALLDWRKFGTWCSILLLHS